MAKYLKHTAKLEAEYRKNYTGHPSNLDGFMADSKLPNGNKDACRFQRNAKTGKLEVVYLWMYADMFSL